MIMFSSIIWNSQIQQGRPSTAPPIPHRLRWSWTPTTTWWRWRVGMQSPQIPKERSFPGIPSLPFGRRCRFWGLFLVLTFQTDHCITFKFKCYADPIELQEWLGFLMISIIKTFFCMRVEPGFSGYSIKVSSLEFGPGDIEEVRSLGAVGSGWLQYPSWIGNRAS